MEKARLPIILAALLLALSCGCTVRKSHTARTSTEQFLLSRAAERALLNFKDCKRHVYKQRVFIDDQYFESVDKPYVMSALRHMVTANGGFVVPKDPKEYKLRGGKSIKLGPTRILEIRSAALGLKDNNFGFGLPTLPLPIPQSNLSTVLPSMWFINRRRQQGWAKFQLWIRQAKDRTFLAQSGDLWGHSYYHQWWFLFFGPYDFSYDNYPKEGKFSTEPRPDPTDPKTRLVKASSKTTSKASSEARAKPQKDGQ